MNYFLIFFAAEAFGAAQSAAAATFFSHPPHHARKLPILTHIPFPNSPLALTLSYQPAALRTLPPGVAMPSPGLGVLSPQQLGFGGLALYCFLGPVAVTSLVLFVVALIVIAYRLVLHPLARVPGPKIAALSNIWYAYHARNGRMLELGKTLHRRYGPMVRVGPNEVWFDSVDAFKHIYSEFQLASF